MAAVSEARAAAERLDQALSAAPYDLPAVLLRSESASSSRIENLTVSAKGVALAQVGRGSSRNARLNVGNIASMEAALTLDGVTAETMERIQGTLVDESSLRGFRDEPVWISDNRYGPREASFVPPAPERVPAYVEDLVAFAARADLDPLIKAFVFHAQFETVHPFADGNGRAGRALVHLLLKDGGVCEASCLPVSAGLLSDVVAYHGALTSFREGDAEPIVCLMAHSLLGASHVAAALKASMDDLLDEWREKVGGRSGSCAERLGPLLVRNPAVTTDFVVGALGVGESAAKQALKRAVDAGMLTRVGAARASAYVCDRVLDAIEETCRMMPLRRGARG
ncbi:Fic family protein [Atopobiaceae bacterium 24-176]